MVRESPYQKAVSLTGMISVFGFVVLMTGISQLATMPRPRWILVWLGLGTLVFGLLMLWYVSKCGREWLSTKEEIVYTPLEEWALRRRYGKHADKFRNIK